MADANAGRSENFGSAAHLMIEALDKASNELDRTVKACIEQLTAFNEDLEKQFVVQLQKVLEQSGGMVDTHVEDLGARREEFLEKLAEFERTEMDTVTAAGRDVRQQITARAQQATDSISRLVDEQVTELRTLIDNPESHFAEFGDNKLEAAREVAVTGKERMEDKEVDCEKRITEKSQSIEQSIQTVIDETKRKIEGKLDSHSREFEEKIGDVVGKLNVIVAQTLSELEEKAESGARAIEASVDQGRNHLAENVENWKSDLERVRRSFEHNLQDERMAAQKAQSAKLERKLSEVKDEINHISQDASTKISASHKLFYASLKRLEKKYYDRLDRLLGRFETAIAQEAKLSSASPKTQSSTELKDVLHARLQARGTEVVKAFRRMVEQLESEYARAGSVSHERLDTIRMQAVESLEKQMRVMTGELDRITRSFNTELSELNSQLPQIEDAGKAASLAVMAYRSAMLSLE